jgi:hypothetical protein
MKLKLLVLICITAPFLFMACASTFPGPGGVFAGGIVGITAIPAGFASIDQRYAAYPDSFTLLGPVEGSASNMNIFGLFAFGNGGAIAAYENALANGQADGMINCNSDIKSTAILGIFSTSKTVIKGIGIKLK